ncbi:hypothetical protein ACIQCR_34135 [Streptomyces sp. NPDC093249]|uniref:hypothetical protein n=1 Tax=unclassified Streptomyces TaxID=2593676 RepID=UPI0037F38140
MRTIDIASAIDYELIRRLDPHVSASTSSQARLADAVRTAPHRTALAEHLPQLLPRALEIIQLLAEHYDVTEWPPDRQRCARARCTAARRTPGTAPARKTPAGDRSHTRAPPAGRPAVPVRVGAADRSLRSRR